MDRCGTGARKVGQVARQTLDPERDYTTIWALSATYYVDDFFMNYLYTTGIQYFTQPPAGSFIMGQYTKKAVDHMQQRTHDTLCRQLANGAGCAVVEALSWGPDMVCLRVIAQQ